MSESTREAGPGEWHGAVESGEWERAFDLLTEADQRDDLDAAELELLAETARWTRRYEVMIEALERSARAFEREGRPKEAGRALVKLTIEHYQRNELALAAGCLGRAEELLGADEESRASGLALFCRIEMLSDQGRIEEAEALAVELAEMARRLGDRDLEALGLMMRGRVAHRSGGFAEGAALMDQAAAGAVAGDLELWTSGVVICANINACRQRWDVRTASEWSDAGVRWCRRNSVGYFPGLCRLHMGESLNLRGDYEAAAAEVTAAIEDLRAAMPRFAADGVRELGEIRRRQGEHADAERLFAESIELGGDGLPGLITLKLDQGHARAALALARDRLEDDLGGTPLSGGAAHVLPAAIAAAVEVGDLEAAAEWHGRLEALARACRTTGLEAAEQLAAGRIALAAGEPDAAIRSLRSARRLWAEADAPYDGAVARALLARARLETGDRDSAIVEAEKALAMLQRIGARFEAGRVQALLDGLRGTPRRATTTMLFTDIAGSTRLVEALGDEAWESMLAWHDRTLRACIEDAGGTILKHEGDGFFASFERPDPAIACAIAIQQRLSAHRTAHGYAPSVRIGIHADEVTDRGGDLSGRGVHVAARVMAAAGAGEILATESTIEIGSDSYEAVDRRALDAKGVVDPVPVARIAWS